MSTAPFLGQAREPPKEKLLSEDRLLEVLEETHRTLEAGGIRYGLIGGVASSVLGRPRTTRDIDLFVKPCDAERVLAALEARGFECERTDHKWIFKAFKHGVQVDIIFLTGRGIYFDGELVERCRAVTFAGVDVWVVAPEDLFVIKAVAHDEATPRHWHDALGLLLKSDFDWDYLLQRSRFGQRRVLSLLLYAQSLDYAVPDRVICELWRHIFQNVRET